MDITRNILTVSEFTQNLSGFGFPSENSINRNLQVTPSASPKEATLPSVNSDNYVEFENLLPAR